MVYNMLNKDNMDKSWRNKLSSIKPEEIHINPPHLQRLQYNPYYYTPEESELQIGDEIVVGTYASDTKGAPNIKWTETTIKGLPLCDFYIPYITCRKKLKIVN